MYEKKKIYFLFIYFYFYIFIFIFFYFFFYFFFYQKENSIYSNCSMSNNFEQFLKLLGEIVNIETHKGFKGKKKIYILFIKTYFIF